MASQSSTSSTSAEFGMLVGIDGSSGGEHALRWATHRTDRFGTIQPLLAWTYPWWAYSSPVPPPREEFEVAARQQAAETLDSVRPLVPTSSSSTGSSSSSTGTQTLLPPIVCSGRPGQTIVEAGAEAKLIVVGTRGRSGLKDTLLGSVSSYVAAHATAPVVVIPPQAQVDGSDGSVTVGVDGSRSSVLALLWAIENSPVDALIDVVHCWVYPTTAIPDVGISSRDVYENNARMTLNETLQRVGEATTDQQRGRLVGRLEYGDARTVLNKRASDSEMLVLGARGHGGIAHLLLGSVATALVHQPKAPTVILRG